MAPEAPPPLPPPIHAQLNHLLQNSPLPIRVLKTCASSKALKFSDQFTLSIPFCLSYVRWDFMYNALHLSSPPDIIFPPDDAEFNPILDIIEAGTRSCLVDWNCTDPAGLLALVNEIRELYKKYQQKRVEEFDDDRVKFEMSTILSREGMEIHMTSGLNTLSAEVKFAIPLLLDINLNQLVPGCPWRQEQKIFLQVVFPVARGYSSTPPSLKLLSSSDLRNLLAVDEVKLPPWSNGMCMAEYLPTLEDDLTLQVKEAAASIAARRQFIQALAPVFGRPVEAEAVFCSKATIFVASGTFTFLILFSIPTHFPKMGPTLTLQSCQHCDAKGVAITSPPINGYPWSPRWEALEMAERICDFLVDECLRFKKYCSDCNAQQ